MRFKIVESKKSPEELVGKLNALADEVEIGAVLGMFWQPRGAVVIVGFQEPDYVIGEDTADYASTTAE